MIGQWEEIDISAKMEEEQCAIERAQHLKALHTVCFCYPRDMKDLNSIEDRTGFDMEFWGRKIVVIRRCPNDEN